MGAVPSARAGVQSQKILALPARLSGATVGNGYHLHIGMVHPVLLLRTDYVSGSAPGRGYGAAQRTQGIAQAVSSAQTRLVGLRLQHTA